MIDYKQANGINKRLHRYFY